MSFLSSLYLKILAYTFRWNDEKRDKGLKEPEGLHCFYDLVYAEKNGKDGLLDIYTPAKEGEALPAIVSVHGGGFCYGDKQRYRFYCMELALQGYTVVNFNYRLLPHRCPAPLEDLNAVLQFLADHAQEYRINPQQVFAVGDSAGATVLSMYTTALSNPRYAGLFPFTPPLRFCAVALHSGEFGLKKRKNLFLREWTHKVERAAELLNISGYIDSTYPPVFLSCSVNDPIVLDTPAFAQILKERGVSHETAVYGEGDKKISHVFHLDIRSQAAKDCNLRQHAFFQSVLSQKAEHL